MFLFLFLVLNKYLHFLVRHILLCLLLLSLFHFVCNHLFLLIHFVLALLCFGIYLQHILHLLIFHFHRSAKFIATPAKISNNIMVIINAISVIPLSFLFVCVCVCYSPNVSHLSFSPSFFIFLHLLYSLIVILSIIFLITLKLNFFQTYIFYTYKKSLFLGFFYIYYSADSDVSSASGAS